VPEKLNFVFTANEESRNIKLHARKME